MSAVWAHAVSLMSWYKYGTLHFFRVKINLKHIDWLSEHNFSVSQATSQPVSFNLGQSLTRSHAHSLSRLQREVIFQIMDFNGGESSTLPTLLCCHTSMAKAKHRENEIDNSNGNNKSNIAYDI